MRILPVATALAAFITSTAAHAWGADGHRTVGTIAADLIAGSPAATQVKALLGDLSLADAALWADCARNVNASFAYTPNDVEFPECEVFEAPDGLAERALEDFVRRNPGHTQFHFSDIAIQHMTYDTGFVGARPDDIVGAIAAVTHVLKGDASPSGFNIKDKAEALKLLAHYVGDVHQPLHVGAVYLDPSGSELNPVTLDPATSTHGGNSISLVPTPTGKKPKKLHAYWDAVPRSQTAAKVTAAWLTAARAVPPTTGTDFDWPKDWASQTVAQANVAFSPLSFGAFTGGAHGHWTVTLPAGYGTTMNPVKKEQLTRAGARLAQLLKDIWH